MLRREYCNGSALGLGRYPRTIGTERSVGATLLSHPAAWAVGASAGTARGRQLRRRARALVVSLEVWVKIVV